MPKLFAPPCNFHATNFLRVMLSLALIFGTLPIRSNSQTTKPKPERRLKTLPRAQDLPNIEATKQDGRLDKSQLAPVAAPQLPTAARCRPADEQCKEFWKKKGIGQLLMPPEPTATSALAQLLATNFLSAERGPGAESRSVSDVPFSPGVRTRAAASAWPQTSRARKVDLGLSQRRWTRLGHSRQSRARPGGCR